MAVILFSFFMLLFFFYKHPNLKNIFPFILCLFCKIFSIFLFSFPILVLIFMSFGYYDLLPEIFTSLFSDDFSEEGFSFFFSREICDVVDLFKNHNLNASIEFLFFRWGIFFFFFTCLLIFFILPLFFLLILYCRSIFTLYEYSRLVLYIRNKTVALVPIFFGSISYTYLIFDFWFSNTGEFVFDYDYTGGYFYNIFAFFFPTDVTFPYYFFSVFSICLLTTFFLYIYFVDLHIINFVLIVGGFWFCFDFFFTTLVFFYISSIYFRNLNIV